ncbi:hypothetical protein AMELA_G00048540 [Ameiurus melas]|uniref:EF-hand domain-containing protein n=1 Tax=Ameiurus melas TaxID=219545 RepID=A0A7J6B6Y6_AMEME|nr:hypothetical protein AMELA_G00048540 [Ameiurus melas]
MNRTVVVIPKPPIGQYYIDELIVQLKQVIIIIFIMGYTKGQPWCCLLLLLLSCCVLCVHSHGDHHGQVSGDPHPPITRLDKNMVQDKDHIMEHLDGVIDKPESDMTPQELQLHYFKMHDYDGNNLLDGLELATAITHVHKEEKGENSAPMKEQELISIIDQVLRDDDKNNDGYIDYAEFAKSLQ